MKSLREMNVFQTDDASQALAVIESGDRPGEL